MPEHDDRVQQVVSDLANALQTAAPLADRLRVMTAKSYEDAVTLDGAIDRAVRALKMLQPGRGEDGGA